MGNYFYGAYHWDIEPVIDRLALLDALEVFCDEEANLFIEVIRPSLLQRFRFWRLRASYQTPLTPDTLMPRATIFHLRLNRSTLDALRVMVKRDGMSERSICHIKGYRGEEGLFWFHGFCDEGDETLSCSRHVDDATVARLESKLGLKAEKKFGEIKSDRERKEELKRFVDAMQRYQGSEEK